MTELIRQLSAMAIFNAYSKAILFKTGSVPGNPRHTGHVCVFASRPKALAQPQKILVRVLNCKCTSRPMTVSYFCSRVWLITTPALYATGYSAHRRRRSEKALLHQKVC